MDGVTWGRRLRVGAAAGVVGGTASSLLLWLLVEPVISQAIRIENAAGDGTHGHGPGTTGHDHAEVVTRLQQQIGGTMAAIIVAILVGVVFAVTYGRVAHRMHGSTDLGRSLSLAGLAFVATALVPSLAVPANPPGVGSPETVDHRALTYVAAILLCVLFMGAVFALNKAAVSRAVAPELRWLLMGAAVAAGALVVLVSPHLEEQIPTAVPAGLIWEFRTGSLAQLAGMWSTIGIAHGFLARRGPYRAPRYHPASTNA